MLLRLPLMLCIFWFLALPCLAKQNPSILFDADETAVSKDLKQQEFKGHVIVIAAGTIIAADEIHVDQEKNHVIAKGKVVVFNQSQILTGSDFTYQTKTGSFRLRDAHLVSNNQQDIKQTIESILGFTDREVDFEADRRRQLRDVRAAKERLLESYGLAVMNQTTVDPRIAQELSRLLEQEDLIALQDNPEVAALTDRDQTIMKRRRDFWDAHKQQSLDVTGLSSTLYFRIIGNSLTRTDGNDYDAWDALFTPCNCDKDESPAWGFRSRHLKAQIGGYLRLEHAVLEIKGIPVFYLPLLVLPIKSERQSGFLPPLFTHERAHGNIASQSAYYVIDPKSDATVTVDQIQLRGTRLTGEYRIKQRKYSGWQVSMEMLRDSKWEQMQSNRETMREIYHTGLESARKEADLGGGTSTAVEDPDDPFSPEEKYRQTLKGVDWWKEEYPKCLGTDEAAEACREQIDQSFANPGNMWRGKVQWQGLTMVAPRLTLVSQGSILSDHRYAQDLYIPQTFEQVFAGDEPETFAASDLHFHLDQEDYYVGVGSKQGDHLLLEDRYASSQQLPSYVTATTRLFSLNDPFAHQIPVYGRLRFDHFRIGHVLLGDYDTPEYDHTTLGEGSWRRLLADSYAPLITDQIIRVSHFAEVEQRNISHSKLAESNSHSQSWRTGLVFELPVTGLSLNSFPMTPEDGTTPFQRFIEHKMKWTTTLSLRPNVVREGPYATTYDKVDNKGKKKRGAVLLNYFATDNIKNISSSKEAFADDDAAFFPHKKITLRSKHRWRFVDQSPIHPDVDLEGTGDAKTYQEKAGLILQKTYGTYAQNRLEQLPTKVTERDAFTTLSTKISYDFLKEEKRQETKAANRKLRDEDPKAEIDALPEPWSALEVEHSLLLSPWQLDTLLEYNIYFKQTTTLISELFLPPFFKTYVGLSYGIAKEINEDLVHDEISVERTHSRGITTESRIIKNTTLKWAYESIEPDGKDKRYATYMAAQYDDPSECWGLNLARSKGIRRDEADARYVLEFNVLFGGQERRLPNMSETVLRETDVGNRGEED